MLHVGGSDFRYLPGGDLIKSGLSDLANGKNTVPALLVSIGSPRLETLGIHVLHPLPSPEKELYRQLSMDNSDAAHSRYNALIRRLVSFERAYETGVFSVNRLIKKI